METGMKIDLNELEKLAREATPQDFDSAVTIFADGWIQCPHCDGEGTVDLEAHYCNYDGQALGVQFYGIGNAYGTAERYYRAARPAVMLALIARIQELEGRAAEAEATAGGASVSDFSKGYRKGYDDGAHDAALKPAPSAPSPEPVASVPDGYAWVPLVPTDVMMDAAEACSDDWPPPRWKAAWSAMVAAAPTPTAPDDVARDAGGDPALAMLERFKNQMTPYGLLIRALRIVAGVTLGDMAEYMGITPARLSGMEHGRHQVTTADGERSALYFYGLGIHGAQESIRCAISVSRNSAIDAAIAAAKGADHE